MIDCPICQARCLWLDAIDFNKSCEEGRGAIHRPSGDLIDYFLCGGCGFCFAPEMSSWSPEMFRERVYNDGYSAVDPDYCEARPRKNASKMDSLFGKIRGSVGHLDYGGGNGRLANILRQSGWNSISYDPLLNRDACDGRHGRFELVTAFEVFEHVPACRLMHNLKPLLAKDGLLVFSTSLSDGNIHPSRRLGWWYAAPRNGHISLFSRGSLAVLARDGGFRFGTLHNGWHVFASGIPAWAGNEITEALGD